MSNQLTNAYLGEIRLFAGDYTPAQWASCNGQLLPIADYQALYALLGTIYGGDGRRTFAVPDLRARVPMGQGMGPGLTPRDLGDAMGAPEVGLDEHQMPRHAHTLQAETATSADETAPEGALPARDGPRMYLDVVPPATMAGQTLDSIGGGENHENHMETLGLGYIICTEGGAFPPRP